MTIQSELLRIRRNLLDGVQLSAIYHRKRERFLALCDKVSKIIALVSGSAAFSTFLKTADAKAAAGLIVAAVTLPDLVFSWADRARLHGEFAQKYGNLEADIESVSTENLTDINLSEWKSSLSRIEAGEPPTLSALTRICQNQMALARGDYAAVTRLT